MWQGKLNQQEKPQPLCTFKCRKVITHECPCINVLSIGTSSYLNVETEPKMKWCGDGETEPTENLHLGNGISALANMKKSKNGCHFKLPTPPKVWVSGLPHESPMCSLTLSDIFYC